MRFRPFHRSQLGLITYEGKTFNTRFFITGIMIFGSSGKAIQSGKLSGEQKESIKLSIARYAEQNISLGEAVHPSRFYGAIFKVEGVVDIKKLVVYEENEARPFVDDIKPNQFAEFNLERMSIYG